MSGLGTVVPRTDAAVPLAPFASASAVTPPPEMDPAAPRWRSLRGLTQALRVLAVGAVVCAVFETATRANRLAALGAIDDRGASFDRLDRLDAADDLGVASGVTFGAVTIALFVIMIVWTWRAAKNNEALGRDHPRLGPGWAIGGWFIPLGNLVLPVLVVQDLWRGSEVATSRGDMRWRIGGRSALVGWWWGTLVASFLITNPLTSSGGTDRITERVDELQSAHAVAMAAQGFAIAAAVLLILVVTTIASRQRATLVAQQAAWTERLAASA